MSQPFSKIHLLDQEVQGCPNAGKVQKLKVTQIGTIEKRRSFCKIPKVQQNQANETNRTANIWTHLQKARKWNHAVRKHSRNIINKST